MGNENTTSGNGGKWREHPKTWFESMSDSHFKIITVISWLAPKIFKALQAVNGFKRDKSWNSARHRWLGR
jgi:hypothetical protein